MEFLEKKNTCIMKNYGINSRLKTGEKQMKKSNNTKDMQ